MIYELSPMSYDLWPTGLAGLGEKGENLEKSPFFWPVRDNLKNENKISSQENANRA
jgi:hypothetical protein